MKTSILPLAVAGLVTLSSSACIFIGNRSNDAAPRNIGAELLDLKKAKDQGLISGEQYKKQQEQILSDSNGKAASGK